MLRYVTLACVLCSWSLSVGQHAWAEESPVEEQAASSVGPDTPVARVNGQVITLRTLENHLLQQEGAEAILDLVANQLRQANWEKVSDDTTIVAMGNWKLPRNILAAQLLSREGGSVRDQLINISLVEQALREDGIIIGDLLLNAELKRMEQRFSARLVQMGQTQIPFDQYIMQTQEMSMQEFMAQPGFRMLAGLHALVLRRASVDDETLQSFYDKFKGSYGHPDQVRLRAIYLDFEVTNMANGQPQILEEHRKRLRDTATNIQKHILSGKTDFARQWQLWGKNRDPQADTGGDVGWVGADGRRQQIGAQNLPRGLISEAMKVVEAGRLPQMLPIVEHQTGIIIAEVFDFRAEEYLAFDEVKNKLRRDYLETNMEELSRDILGDIRRAAEIDYESLGSIVHKKNAEVRRLTESGLGGGDQPTGEKPISLPGMDRQDK